MRETFSYLHFLFFKKKKKYVEMTGILRIKRLPSHQKEICFLTVFFTVGEFKTFCEFLA